MNIKNSGVESRPPGLKKLGKVFLLIGFCLSVAAGVSAQPGGGGEGDPDDPVPFDGGITLLAAAGVAYGIKQWKGDKKKKDSETME